MKLTDTQLMLLSSASQRPDRGVAMTDRLKGAVAQRVISNLVKNGLLEEVRRSGELPEWHRDDTGEPSALVITDKGLDAIGVEPDAKAIGAAPADQSAKAGGLPRRTRPVEKSKSTKAGEGTKTAQLVGLLQRKQGSSIDEIETRLGWQPHTIRAAITGLRKRGFAVNREQSKAGKSVYRVVGTPSENVERGA